MYFVLSATKISYYFALCSVSDYLDIRWMPFCAHVHCNGHRKCFEGSWWKWLQWKAYASPRFSNFHFHYWLNYLLNQKSVSCCNFLLVWVAAQLQLNFFTGQTKLIYPNQNFKNIPYHLFIIKKLVSKGILEKIMVGLI